jgi:hypothetical protein
VSDPAPYVAAAGAVFATWLLEHTGGASSILESVIPPGRAAGYDNGLTAAAREELACGVRRLSSVRTWYGAAIRTLPSGAGEDFVREFWIQRANLNAARGELGIPGLTNRPRLTAECAAQWIELWLDAWQVCNAANPRAFALDHGRFELRGPLGSPIHFDPAGSWRTAEPRSAPSHLGKVIARARGLHTEARIVSAVPFVGELVWIKARQVTETLLDLAGALDWCSGIDVANGQIVAEAAATLRRELHPVRYVEKATGVVVGAAELALTKVAGPVLSATVGAIAMTLIPWLVVGGVTYYLVRRQIG